MKHLKRRILLGLLFLGFLVLVKYAKRDLNLDVDLLKEGLMKMPGVIMENMTLEREISGDLWKVKIPFVERRSDWIWVRSLDIRRELPGGREWYFFGAAGVYSHDVRAAAVRGLLGTLETETRVLNLESPELDWQDSRNEFLFPKGLVLYDQEFILTAGQASMDESGVVLLERGGKLKWTKPLS